MQKEYTFDDLPAPEVTLDLYYSYSYTPAKLDGDPGSCCPAEEDSEVCLPSNFERDVMNAYVGAARLAMKHIEDKVQDMNFDNMPREWAEREAREC